MLTEPSKDWIEDSMDWWGYVLTGEYAHWCPDWDDLPIDETKKEFICCTCSLKPKDWNTNLGFEAEPTELTITKLATQSSPSWPYFE